MLFEQQKESSIQNIGEMNNYLLLIFELYFFVQNLNLIITVF
jgi:hypothetical protein